MVLEPILREHVEQTGARVDYNTNLVSFDQNDAGVTAVVRGRDGGEERTVRARYLIAADGSRSPARERLGIPMTGHGVFSNSLTIYFRADVRELVGDRNLSVIYVFNDLVQGFFRIEKTLDSGFFAVSTARGADGNRTSNVCFRAGCTAGRISRRGGRRSRRCRRSVRRVVRNRSRGRGAAPARRFRRLARDRRRP